MRIGGNAHIVCIDDIFGIERQIVHANEVLPDGRRRVVEAASGVLLCVVLDDEAAGDIVIGSRRLFKRQPISAAYGKVSGCGRGKRNRRRCSTGGDVAHIVASVIEVRRHPRIGSGVCHVEPPYRGRDAKSDVRRDVTAVDCRCAHHHERRGRIDQLGRGGRERAALVARHIDCAVERHLGGSQFAVVDADRTEAV